MKFNLKKYQIFKLKTYLKEKDFLIFHCAKLNLKQWIIIEQHLKKLNLKYYKPLNGISLKILNTSTHKYFSHIINGPVLFIEYDSKLLEIDLVSILKKLEPEFIFLAIKLNNVIYMRSCLNKLKTLNYKSNIGSLSKVMDNFLSFTPLSSSKFFSK